MNQKRTFSMKLRLTMKYPRGLYFVPFLLNLSFHHNFKLCIIRFDYIRMQLKNKGLGMILKENSKFTVNYA